MGDGLFQRRRIKAGLTVLVVAMSLSGIVIIGWLLPVLVWASGVGPAFNNMVEIEWKRPHFLERPEWLAFTEVSPTEGTSRAFDVPGYEVACPLSWWPTPDNIRRGLSGNFPHLTGSLEGLDLHAVRFDGLDGGDDRWNWNALIMLGDGAALAYYFKGTQRLSLAFTGCQPLGALEFIYTADNEWREGQARWGLYPVERERTN